MDKFFDKIVDSNLFMKIVALILALLLFSSVYDGSKDLNDINVPGEQDTAVLDDIPVKSYYDTENLVITGIPDTVKVTIEGPTSHVQPAKTQRNFEVFVDLTNVKIGKKEVPLEVKDISDKLKVTIEPATVMVTIQEKVTKEFKVEAEFNHSLLKDGLVSEQPIVEPSMVKITGAKEVIDQITYVKANVDVNQSITESISKEAEVTVLDKDLNKLPVIVEPKTVKVTIPVKNLSKTVPIKIQEIGSLPGGLEIDSITLSKDKAKIIGKEDVLNKIENVRVEVDLSKINEDTELTLPVIISDGVTSVDPQLVTAIIKVRDDKDLEEVEETVGQNQQTKVIKNIPIQVEGLNEKYIVNFNEPVNGISNITITGEESEISDISESDFYLYVDVTNLTEGEHVVDIKINGPENISWELSGNTANILISQKNA